MSVVATGAPRTAARRRALIWTLAAAIVAGLVYLMATASTGPVDPTEVSQPQSRATIVFNAGMIVFREGLEAVLIFAAVTASFRGANRARRRPVVAGGLGAVGGAGAAGGAAPGGRAVRVRRRDRHVVRRPGGARRGLRARPAAGGDHRLPGDRRAPARAQLV